MYLASTGVCRVVGKVSADSTFYSGVEVSRVRLNYPLTSPDSAVPQKDRPTSSTGPPKVLRFSSPEHRAHRDHRPLFEGWTPSAQANGNKRRQPS